jgi:hypothetical protein
MILTPIVLAAHLGPRGRARLALFVRSQIHDGRDAKRRELRDDIVRVGGQICRAVDPASSQCLAVSSDMATEVAKIREGRQGLSFHEAFFKPAGGVGREGRSPRD